MAVTWGRLFLEVVCGGFGFLGGSICFFVGGFGKRLSSSGYPLGVLRCSTFGSLILLPAIAS